MTKEERTGVLNNSMISVIVKMFMLATAFFWTTLMQVERPDFSSDSRQIRPDLVTKSLNLATLDAGQSHGGDGDLSKDGNPLSLSSRGAARD